MNRARNADHAARTCKRFVYPTVKITRLYDYQTWWTHFLRNSRGAQRQVDFFLDCAFRMLIGWAGKFQSRGSNTKSIGRMLWRIFVRGHTFRFCLQENGLSSVIPQTVPLGCTHQELFLLSHHNLSFRLIIQEFRRPSF